MCAWTKDFIPHNFIFYVAYLGLQFHKCMLPCMHTNCRLSEPRDVTFLHFIRLVDFLYSGLSLKIFHNSVLLFGNVINNAAFR
jgi:hypothetical protein